MVELMMICKGRHVNSLVTNLFVAMEAKKAGVDVAVLLTESTLTAITERSFELSALLRPHANKIAENMKNMGLPADPLELVKATKDAGVPIYACPAWVGLLDLKGKLPPEITEIDLPTALKAIGEAKKVIGTF